MNTEQLRGKYCRVQGLVMKTYMKHLVKFKPHFRKKDQKHEERMKAERVSLPWSFRLPGSGESVHSPVGTGEEVSKF